MHRFTTEGQLRAWARRRSRVARPSIRSRLAAVTATEWIELACYIVVALVAIAPCLTWLLVGRPS